MDEARSRQPDQPQAATRWVLWTTILASSLAFVDGSVVNVGLPAIQGGLRADPAALQWVINAYLLPLGALLLLGGASGDRLGRKAVFIAGIAVFGLASAVCALAWNLGILIGARSVQGVAAAFVLPNSLAILGTSFTGSARGRAIGIWAAAGAAVGAAGPLLGGWLIDLFGWRMVFIINLPLAALALLMAVSFVQELPPANRHMRLDLGGSTLATLGLGVLTWALTIASGPEGWSSRARVAALASAALLGGFLRVERVRGAHAAMPLALFSSRSFVGLTVLTLLVYGALGALLLLIPYVLIEGGQFSATAAGAALLPAPLVIAALSPAAGGLAGRIGARPLLSIGSLIVGAGFLVLLFERAGSSYWSVIFPSLVLVAVGMSAVAAPLTTAVLSAAGADTAGAASGLNSAVSRIGGTFAVALLGGIIGTRGAQLVHAFHGAALVAALACLAAAVTALLLVDGRRPAA
ncbi:MAG: MFS transporter [Proteobacteria bacterium]|nr:MFS transporter [Pseudomonadota bacterium]